MSIGISNDVHLLSQFVIIGTQSKNAMVFGQSTRYFDTSSGKESS